MEFFKRHEHTFLLTGGIIGGLVVLYLLYKWYKQNQTNQANAANQDATASAQYAQLLSALQSQQVPSGGASGSENGASTSTAGSASGLNPVQPIDLSGLLSAINAGTAGTTTPTTTPISSPSLTPNNIILSGPSTVSPSTAASGVPNYSSQTQETASGASQAIFQPSTTVLGTTTSGAPIYNGNTTLLPNSGEVVPQSVEQAILNSPAYQNATLTIQGLVGSVLTGSESVSNFEGDINAAASQQNAIVAASAGHGYGAGLTVGPDEQSLLNTVMSALSTNYPTGYQASQTGNPNYGTSAPITATPVLSSSTQTSPISTTSNSIILSGPTQTTPISTPSLAMTNTTPITPLVRQGQPLQFTQF